MSQRHVLFIGAHPDDCDFAAGGAALALSDAGWAVRFVSVTNGDRGHMDSKYRDDRAALARRRLNEGLAAVATFGGDYRDLGVHDGEVYVTAPLTERMTAEIRSWGEPGQGPDLVICNRPNDYHRDHRYTSQLVLDSFYLLTVPFFMPTVPHLKRMPVLLYWWDRFREGGDFRADVALPLDSFLERKVAIAYEHESQFFEWLPYNFGSEDVPEDPAGRFQMAREWLTTRGVAVAEDLRSHHPDLLPPGIHTAEAFQVSEYGRRPSAEEFSELFPPVFRVSG